ncbi:hypothetical protein [Caulobacter radicis]|nr:hypothetical protein [Caulobacter radicis]
MNGLLRTLKTAKKAAKYRHAENGMVEVPFPEKIQGLDAGKSTVRPDLP